MGHVDALEVPLQGSRDLNIRSSDQGRIALVIAIANGQTDAARLLAAQEKIEVETPEDGLTPLTAAAIFGMADIIPNLVARVADVNGHNGHPSPPIVQAVGYNGIEAAKTLLSSTSIDVDRVSRVRGGTALHYAISWETPSLWSFGHWSRPSDQRRCQGFRPIDYALSFNDQRILGLLKASDPENGVRSD